ncbi:hypothetical protein Mapa_006237 [Marchantia paleacea]|nr:hypothetical protein Mapa_006237 [Marchantia paleacea]
MKQPLSVTFPFVLALMRHLHLMAVAMSTAQQSVEKSKMWIVQYWSTMIQQQIVRPSARPLISAPVRVQYRFENCVFASVVALHLHGAKPVQCSLRQTRTRNTGFRESHATQRRENVKTDDRI